jgi:hypothetical protein
MTATGWHTKGALAIALSLALLIPRRARGDGPPLAADLSSVASGGRLTIDGGLLLALPTALGPGLSTGFALGVTRGRRFAWQARASWSTATESSIPWTVTQWDLRLRVGGALQHSLGGARVGLRLGVGPTIVHETRVRNQGMAAALTGSALETSTYATLPAGDLEAFVALQVFGPWLLALSGGPSAAIDGGTFRGGWVTFLGIGWQP